MSIRPNNDKTPTYIELSDISKDVEITDEGKLRIGHNIMTVKILVGEQGKRKVHVSKTDLSRA